MKNAHSAPMDKTTTYKPSEYTIVDLDGEDNVITSSAIEGGDNETGIIISW